MIKGLFSIAMLVIVHIALIQMGPIGWGTLTAIWVHVWHEARNYVDRKKEFDDALVSLKRTLHPTLDSEEAQERRRTKDWMGSRGIDDRSN